MENKTREKSKVKIVLAIFALMGAAVFGKDIILKTVVAASMSNVTHVAVNIGSFKAHLFAGGAELKEIHIQNPASFQDRTMLDVPELTVDFDLKSLFSRPVHFQAIRLYLKEVLVIKNKDGQINIDSLKPGKKESGSAQQGKSSKLRIDKLTLSIGKVVYKDYSHGDSPRIQEFNINMQDKEYRNITNPQQLVGVILWEALAHTTLSKLTDLSLFTEGAGGVLNLAEDSANLLKDKAKGILKFF